MEDKYKSIGVFDSGLGGVSVLRDLAKLMPSENFIYFGDSYYAPYGKRTKEDIIKKSEDICDFFIEEDVKAIVIACNTATSAAAPYLRGKYNIPIIGMEPALKVVADGVKGHNIVVMATELTLKEEKFKNLMSKYQDDNNIIKMPCPEFVEIVEAGKYNNEVVVVEQLKKYFLNIDVSTVDSVVLGCTHFVFLKNHIAKFLGPKVKIADGNLGTARHLKDILEQSGKLNPKRQGGDVMFFNSCYKDSMIDLSKELFYTTL